MGIALIEPMIIQNVHVSGIVPEDLGDGTMRFTGFAKQKSFDFDGHEFVVVSRTIMSVPSVMESIKATMQELGLACCGGERLRLRH